MTGKMNKTPSKELLKVEAHMSDTPKCLCLNNNKPKVMSTYRPQPSSVLQRAQNFLPQIAKANEDLREKMTALPHNAFDIERVDESAGPHIEMNIAIMEREDSDSSSISDLSDTDSSGEDEEDNKSDDQGDSADLPSSDKTKTEPAILFPLNENSIKLPGVTHGLKKQSIEILSTSSEMCKDADQSKDFCDVDSVR